MSEEIYNSIAYYMKEDVGLPYRYDELTIEQRVFIDAFVEGFGDDADEQIANLESILSELERELAETELECHKLQVELENREGPFV